MIRINGINGSVINAIEYFITIYQSNTDITLLLIGKYDRINTIKLIISDRYNINLDCLDNIRVLRERDLPSYSCDKILCLDYGSLRSLSLCRYNKLYLIYNESRNPHYEEIYKKFIFDYKTIFYIKQNSKSKKNYKLKIPFQLYKKHDIKDSLDYTYINLNSKGDIRDYNHFIHNNKNIKILPKNLNGQFNSHPLNFFSLFNKFIYIHDGKYFDPCPRSFHEMKFYNKEIIYINKHSIKDGSNYMYDRVLNVDIENEDRLDETDIIIKEFL